MIIVWNNRFEAQFTEFKVDLDAVKAAGFKTSGAPEWIWFTSAIKTLDKLRKIHSNLEITEVALQQYNLLTEKFKQKQQLRKQFKQTQKQAEAPDDTYIDDTGIVCLIVKPRESKFVWGYIRPPDPEERCLLCDSPLYFVLDGLTFCAWCELENKT